MSPQQPPYEAEQLYRLLDALHTAAAEAQRFEGDPEGNLLNRDIYRAIRRAGRLGQPAEFARRPSPRSAREQEGPFDVRQEAVSQRALGGFVYVGTSDYLLAREFMLALSIELKPAGFETVGEPIYGSVLQQIKVVNATTRLVRKVFRKVVANAAELPEAQAAQARMSGTAELVEQVANPALGDVLIQVGNQLMIKSAAQADRPAVLVAIDLEPGQPKAVRQALKAGLTPIEILASLDMGEPPALESGS